MAQSTALVVLGRAPRQHMHWFDDNDAAIGKLLFVKNRFHRANINRLTNANKAASYRSHRLVQQQLWEIQDVRTACNAEGIQGYANSNEWKKFFAASKDVYGTMDKEGAPTAVSSSLRRHKFYSDRPSTSEASPTASPPSPTPPSPICLKRKPTLTSTSHPP
ncbi:hypothetical protein SprV_0401724400 [Sparganum proliferum]